MIDNSNKLNFCESHKHVDNLKSPIKRTTCLSSIGFIHSFSTGSVEDFSDLASAEFGAIFQPNYELEPGPNVVDGTDFDVD